MKVFKKDISEKTEFHRAGYDYKNIYYNDRFHTGVWELRKGDKVYGYEVIRGKKMKNPDGSIVYVYPCDEDFGKCGFYITGNDAYNKSFERLHDIERDAWMDEILS